MEKSNSYIKVNKDGKPILYLASGNYLKVIKLF